MADSTEKTIQSEARTRRCWSCGEKAIFGCTGCNKGLYCSQNCQREDWRGGGHKNICKGPPSAIKINVILRELFLAEYAWLQSFDQADKERFFYEDYRDESVNHIAISGEVALVLARVNAAAILNRPTMHTSRFGRAYYNNVISPWYEKHKDFLNQEGFYVDFIDHDLFLADCFCSCIEEDGTPCGKLAFQARGAALLKDVRSPKLALVDKVFAVPRPPTLDDWNEVDSVNYQDMMDCISFVAQEDLDDETRTAVQFVFDYPGQVYGCEDVCCSPCFRLRFDILAKDAAPLGTYFRKARRAMAAIGFPISMDMRHQEAWPDVAIGKAWFAAAGSINVFTQWLENDALPFVVRVDEDRRDRIIRHAYQQGLPVE